LNGARFRRVEIVHVTDLNPSSTVSEPGLLFVVSQRCGKRGADVRPDFEPPKMGLLYNIAIPPLDTPKRYGGKNLNLVHCPVP
jgi:hypothetical protein